MAGDDSLAWRLFVELRREILEQQKLRGQTLGFKVTAVGAGLGLIVANADDVGWELLALPALAAVFFDLLTNGYSVRIKRIGHYIRTHLEPQLRDGEQWKAGRPLWEEYMSDVAPRQWYAISSQFGLTALVSIAGIAGLIAGAHWAIATVRSILLVVSVAYSLWTSLEGWRIAGEA